MTMQKNMVFHTVEGVILAVHGPANPTDDEWMAYVQHCESLPKAVRRTLALTRGGGPNAGQRKILQERYLKQFVNDKANPMKVAVVTNSAMVRGIVTALSWFNPNTDAFSEANLQDAIKYLGIVDAIAASKVSIELRKLQKELGI